MSRSTAQDLSNTAYKQLIATAIAAVEARARRPGTALSSTAKAVDWFRLKLADYEHEVFAAAWLDNRNRLLAFEELFRGTLDAITVPAREIVKAALRHNAAAVLFAHNHPSGNAIASGEDVVLTIELARALDLVNVRVLDHFVITATEPPRTVWAGISPSMRPSNAAPPRDSKRAEALAKKRVKASKKTPKKRAREDAPLRPGLRTSSGWR
ncbi:MAG TPA: JAB domain-containing protein [Tahibacter sp.]|uniref:JAB domain-containing protein n=1 Tax=Tahibacter sp. TaxID=2056211 RepID=UPI002CDC53E3|nr:JAB domain-containing protein [Tahibacter sp.]HSX61618.1 JAB domain-containing protein [Tahibacter sp.]